MAGARTQPCARSTVLSASDTQVVGSPAPVRLPSPRGTTLQVELRSKLRSNYWTADSSKFCQTSRVAFDQFNV